MRESLPAASFGFTTVTGAGRRRGRTALGFGAGFDLRDGLGALFEVPAGDGVEVSDE
jgi:hypothetical protein